LIPDHKLLFLWLYKKEDVFAYVTEREWYDIGSKDQLEKADKKFKG